MKALLLTFAVFICLSGKAQIFTIDSLLSLSESKFIISDSTGVVMEMDANNVITIYDTLSTIRTLIDFCKQQSKEYKDQQNYWVDEQEKHWKREDKLDSGAIFLFHCIPANKQKEVMTKYFEIVR